MTDFQKRWTFAVGSLAALAFGWAGWANRRMFTVSDITTGESSTYPELHSRVYYADPAQVLNAAEQAVCALARWQVVRVEPENLALDAEVGMRPGGVTDDVTVYLTPLGGGQTRAVIRSHSRGGRGDLGRNAAHIRELQGHDGPPPDGGRGDIGLPPCAIMKGHDHPLRCPHLRRGAGRGVRRLRDGLARTPHTHPGKEAPATLQDLWRRASPSPSAVNCLFSSRKHSSRPP